jgi:F-type H+-transporting ATPase subunit b
MTIDWWTLGIQAVNVIILIWLLARFFWRPVAATIAQRRAAAAQLLAEAEASRRQAADALAEIKRTRAGFDSEHDAIIAAAHGAAEDARTALLATAAQEAAAIKAAATAEIGSERRAAEAAWAERAGVLAVEIARRLVARLDGPVVTAAFLDWLLKEIRALPASDRAAMAADGVILEAISPAPIAAADQDRYRKLIGEAFGVRLQIVFKEDPALVAGLELRGPNLVVSNSWRADLAKILADLAHDQQS